MNVVLEPIELYEYVTWTASQFNVDCISVLYVRANQIIPPHLTDRITPLSDVHASMSIRCETDPLWCTAESGRARVCRLNFRQRRSRNLYHRREQER